LDLPRVEEGANGRVGFSRFLFVERIRTQPHLPGAGGSSATLPLVLAAAAAVSVGGLVARWPVVGISLAAALTLIAAATRISLLGAVQFLLALLPWMLVFDAFIPPLTRTFVTAAAAAGVLALSVPLQYRRVLGPVCAAIFAAVILAHAAGATEVDQFTKLAKFLIFPVVAAAVLSKRGQEVLPQVRNVVVASGLAALTVHLLIVTAGLGERGYRYGVGEKIGFGPEIPHELALMAVVMAAAGLTMTERVLPRAGLFALGVLPALLTGVRSALVGIALILVVMLYQSRFSGRSLAVLGIVAVVALGTGAQAALTERLSADVASGASFEGVSNARSDIWNAAIASWWDPGPGTWVVGTGPDSIPTVVERELGQALIGHSDVVEILVELGLVALVAWLLLWVALFRGGLNPILLIPVAVYAVVNGAIAYVAAMTLALVLAAACRPPSRSNGAAEPARAGGD
jgi:O-Antigen ligase